MLMIQADDYDDDDDDDDDVVRTQTYYIPLIIIGLPDVTFSNVHKNCDKRRAMARCKMLSSSVMPYNYGREYLVK